MPIAQIIIRGLHCRRWRRLIRYRRLLVPATCNPEHQRRQKYPANSGSSTPSAMWNAAQGLGASLSGVGGAACAAAAAARRSSIRCASLCNSAAAARNACDPLRRMSGTTSSLIYVTTLRTSSSARVAASRNCCSQRLGASLGMGTPLHNPVWRREKPRVNAGIVLLDAKCPIGNARLAHAEHSRGSPFDLHFPPIPLKEKTQPL